MSVKAVFINDKKYIDIIGAKATVTNEAISFNQPYGYSNFNAWSYYNVPNNYSYICYGQATSSEGITYYYLSQDTNFDNVHGWVPSKYVKIGGVVKTLIYRTSSYLSNERKVA